MIVSDDLRIVSGGYPDIMDAVPVLSGSLSLLSVCRIFYRLEKVFYTPEKRVTRQETRSGAILCIYTGQNANRAI